MSVINLEDHHRFAVVRMNGGVTNAINPALVDQLYGAIEKIKAGYEGMILAGGSKFFCIGFDVPTLMRMTRTEMAQFLTAFDQLTFDLFTAPMPTISVMAGHAIGGGNILALTTDYRIAADGKKLIGLNEVTLGVPVPYLPDLILRQQIGDRAATELLYHGNMISMDAAVALGLVDAVTLDGDVEADAFARMEKLLSVPRSGFVAIKENRVEAIQKRWCQNHRVKREVFIDCWFSEAVQKRLSEAAKKF